MFNKLNSAILLLLMVAVLFGGVVLPQRAEATGIPTIDIAAIGVAITNYVKNNADKAFRDIIVKKLMDYITAQTVQWISGGGKPLFVTDFRAFTKQAGDIAFDSVVQSVGAGAICEPFKLQLRFMLLPVRTFPVQISCTLDKVVGNIQGFYNDFTKGGYGGFVEVMKPQNNLYGQLITANDEINNKQAAAQAAAQNEAIAGSGFLSVKKCSGGTDQATFCRSTCINSGKLAADVSSCVDQCMAVKLSEEELCTDSGGKMTTQTPGDTVGKMAANAVGADTWYAASLQSFMSAITNAAINRLAAQGLAKMTGKSAASYYPPEYAQLLVGQVNSQKTSMQDDIKTNYLNPWNAVIAKKQDSLDAANSAIDTIDKIIGFDGTGGLNSQLNSIDVCRSNVLSSSQIASYLITRKSLVTAAQSHTIPPSTSVIPGTLSAEITNYNNYAADAQDAINFIIATTADAAGTSQAQNKHDTFVANYSYFQPDLQSGTILNDATAENSMIHAQLAAFTATLTDLQSKFNTCTGAP